MIEKVIICDECKKQLPLNDGWNDPFYIELIFRNPISTSLDRSVYQFCSESCVVKFLTKILFGDSKE